MQKEAKIYYVYIKPSLCSVYIVFYFVVLIQIESTYKHKTELTYTLVDKKLP